MTTAGLIALFPYLILAGAAVIVLLVIAFYRRHGLTAFLTLAGLGAAFASLPSLPTVIPRAVTPLIIVDGYAVFFMGIVIAASFITAVLSYGYFAKREGNHEEFYLLLLLATLGSAVLAAAKHFASFFLGLETLSISLYALVAYRRETETGIEAGVKYLMLAAVSSAFILFGMALVYAELGTLEFGQIAGRAGGADVRGLLLTAGFVMITVGLGFKLAVVPFHMWTPDVYEGAPAPMTAYVATVSKGAVFGLLLRYFTGVDVHAYGTLLLIFIVIAVASMFTGNLLALLQNNVKRILAYSSIAHLGYLLVAFLASGAMAITAAAFYLIAYFITTLGAFGVVSVLSGSERDADAMEDYQGLARRRPWVAGVFTAMLLSLAGIPLTAGFVGKFYVVAAGIESGLWLLVVVLVVNSTIGLFYYLRIIVAMYRLPEEGEILKARTDAGPLSVSSSAVLAALAVCLVWVGSYPAPVIRMIQSLASRMG